MDALSNLQDNPYPPDFCLFSIRISTNTKTHALVLVHIPPIPPIPLSPPLGRPIFVFTIFAFQKIQNFIKKIDSIQKTANVFGIESKYRNKLVYCPKNPFTFSVEIRLNFDVFGIPINGSGATGIRSG